MSLNPALLSSERMDWATPPVLFARLHERFGFTVDGAAHHDNHKLARWFGPGGEAEDGLVTPWTGERVWLNPPYGREIGTWTTKARSAVQEEGCRLVVALVPARTDTRWWHRDVMQAASEILLVKGRIRFVGAPAPAPFPSAIVAWEPTLLRPRWGVWE